MIGNKKVAYLYNLIVEYENIHELNSAFQVLKTPFQVTKSHIEKNLLSTFCFFMDICIVRNLIHLKLVELRFMIINKPNIIYTIINSSDTISGGLSYSMVTGDGLN